MGDPIFRALARIPNYARNVPFALAAAILVMFVFGGMAMIVTNHAAPAALASATPTLIPPPESINTFANAVSEGRATATQDPVSHAVQVTYDLEPGTLAEVTAQVMEACDQMQAAIWAEWNGLTPRVTVRFFIDSIPGQWGGSCVMTQASAAEVTSDQEWENVTLVWSLALGHISYVEE